jgi:hypothetical protein
MGMDDEIRRRKQADEAMLRAGLISRLSDSMKAAMGLTPYTGPHSALASCDQYIDEMRKTLSLASGAAHLDISRVSGFADRYAAEVRAPAPNRGGPWWPIQRHLARASKLPQDPMVREPAPERGP